jgi:nucleotide-binding universal stress UspA family protein
MYRKIMVPLDGSPLAERALPYAEVLARRSGAALVLMRAVEANVLPGRDTAASRHHVVREAEAYLDDLVSRLDPAQTLRAARGVGGVETAVYYGTPQQGIVEEIQLRGADLVVMSTHGRSGLSRLLMGSVADHVLRQAPVPVMLVPASCDRSWEAYGIMDRMDARSGRPLRVLVPLDGTSYSGEALCVVRDLAQVAPVHITLLSAVELAPTLFYPSGAFGMEEELQNVESEAMLRRLTLTHDAEDLEDISHYVSVSVAVDTAAHAIVDRAARERADLVVMATHGRGGLSRFLMGSVASSVLHDLKCPILLVRGQPARQMYARPLSTAASTGVSAGLLASKSAGTPMYGGAAASPRAEAPAREEAVAGVA